MASRTRHKSLFGEINSTSTEGDQSIFAHLEQLDKDEIDAFGFGRTAESRHNAQDRILVEYETYLRLFQQADNATTAEEWSELAFPAVHTALFAKLRHKICKAAYQEREIRISYRGLTAYRAALIFWANRRQGERNLPQIPQIAMFDQLTEAIRLAAKEYELSGCGLRNLTHVGLAELHQLIDHDMISTASVEVAENHHIAWCIGRICCVPPRSIAGLLENRGNNQSFLRRRDVTITRCAERGKFHVKIHFRFLGTGSSGPQHGAILKANSHPLFCHVLPPQSTQNLVFSIPHRLLVIALRRNLLLGIETLDQLFEGDQCDITIKPESLDQPILLTSAPGRLKVTSKPLTEGRLTDYLQLRGRRLGYVKDITFDSIRRRSGIDLGGLMGPDLARKIMECDAEYRGLRHDMDRTPSTNLSAITLNGSFGQTHAMIEGNAQLALNPLPSETVYRIHGAALTAMVRRMVATDPDYPIGGSDQDQQNYRR